METPTPPPPPSTTAVKTPDPESEPPQSNSISKQLPPPLTTTNGILKRHKLLHHHQPPPVIVIYKECLKNHAATIGGHAIDGCGEFMPSPTSSPTYPTSLKCAACGCHRNFHRREPDESLNFPSSPNHHVIEYQPHHRHHPPPPPPADGSPGNSLSPPPISSSYYPSAPHMLLSLAQPAENNANNYNPAIPATPGAGVVCRSNSIGKKRFRTKFTQNQKEKMQEIAERVGWKMQKRDEEMIIRVCNEIGVDKSVFKVWMHNNKMNFGNNKKKKDFGNDIIVNGNGNNNCSGEEGIDFIISRNNDRHHETGNNRVDHHLHLHNNGSFSTGGNVIGSTKASSSSS